MRMRSKLLVAVSAAACLVAIAAGAVSANKLSIGGRSMRAVWERMEFTVGIEREVQYMMRCPVTLDGTFSSATFTKLSHLLIGSINRASVGGCGAEYGATALNESLPWFFSYESFSGSLPNISGMTIAVVGMSWMLEAGGVLRCLFRTTHERPAVGTIPVTAGTFGSISWKSEWRILHPLETLECPYRNELTLGGTSGSLTAEGGTARVSLTLI